MGVYKELMASPALSSLSSMYHATTALVDGTNSAMVERIRILLKTGFYFLVSGGGEEQPCVLRPISLAPTAISILGILMMVFSLIAVRFHNLKAMLCGFHKPLLYSVPLTLSEVRGGMEQLCNLEGCFPTPPHTSLLCHTHKSILA